METRTFTADDRDAWREYYDRLEDAGPYHDPDYLALLAGNFEFEAEAARCFVLEAGDEFVYYPYLRRPLSTLSWAGESAAGAEPDQGGGGVAAVDPPVDLAAYADIVASWYYGGPVLSPGADEQLADGFADAFGSHCQAENVVAEFVRFDPNLANHADFEAMDPQFNRETVPVDLTRSVAEIRESYEDRNDRAIRQAEETDLVVEPTTDPADVAAFHAIYADAMDAKDADPHYRFTESFFADLVGREDLATLLVVRLDDTVVGGFIAVHDDRVGHHYLSASEPDYWDMRVNNLLFHEVVVHMRETGREVFDFQGGRPGVFKFKKGFSPDRREFYIGRRTHLPDVYDDLVAAASTAGVDTDSGYFPAYRREQSN